MSELLSRLATVCTSEKPEFRKVFLDDHNVVSGNRKARLIHVPNRAMRQVHEHIKEWLANLTFRHSDHLSFESAYGAMKGKSARKGLLQHLGNRYIYAIDLKSAYRTVSVKQMAIMLHDLEPALGTNQEVLRFLNTYCFSGKEGLVTGAPASPALFNLYLAYYLDRNVWRYAHSHGLIYTRYLDDLTFSSPEPIGRRKRRAIREFVEFAGFSLEMKKTVVWDLAEGPIVLNGIGLDVTGRMFLPRKYVTTIRGVIGLVEQCRFVDPPDKLHGMMGVFCNATHRLTMNATEQHLWQRYRRIVRSARIQRRRMK